MESNLKKANLALPLGQVRNAEDWNQLRGRRVGGEGRAKIHIRAIELIVN